MALATTCPACSTSFKVNPEQLKLRKGLVRCGVCQKIFSGHDYLRYVSDSRAGTLVLQRVAAAAGNADAGPTSLEDMKTAIFIPQEVDIPGSEPPTTPEATAGRPPRVFLSYSYDSREHVHWVESLATALRKHGVEAMLDTWHLKVGQDIPGFMNSEVRLADRVLLICSDPYVRKAESRVGGVGYECLIVSSEVAQAVETKKFLPLVRNNSNKTIPSFLGSRKYLDFSDDREYQSQLDDLLHELWERDRTPPIGSNPFE